MLQKYNKYRLLKIFLFSPTESFRLRQLSRLCGFSIPAVMNYLSEFEKTGLISKIIKEKIPFYKANLHNESFSFYQKLSILYEIQNSGLSFFLWEKLAPEAIILYGSFAKGEANEQSDLDIFIIGKEKSLDVSFYEKKIGKQIHLMFEESANKISKGLKNNLINGIVIKGYFKAV